MSTNPTKDELASIYSRTRELEKFSLQAKELQLKMENEIASLKEVHGVPASALLDIENGIWVKVVGKNQDGTPKIEAFC